MAEVLVAGGHALLVLLGLGVLAWGLVVIVLDRPLNPERSTRSGDTPTEWPADPLGPRR